MDSCIVGYSLKGLLRKRWADERVGVMITVAYYCGLLLWLTSVAKQNGVAGREVELALASHFIGHSSAEHWNRNITINPAPPIWRGTTNLDRPGGSCAKAERLNAAGTGSPMHKNRFPTLESPSD